MESTIENEIKVSSRAYIKMFLHCAKYPHCAVNGLLLAEKSKSLKSDEKLVFVDAIPLFHICLHLSPMYEIALTQVDHMAASKGLVIAGYYLANEILLDSSFDTGHKVADKIAENFPSACLVVISNLGFAPYVPEEHPLNVYQYSDGKWKPRDKSIVEVRPDTLNLAYSLMETKAQDIVDFDNHLDNLSLDWWNAELNEEIDSDNDST